MQKKLVCFLIVLSFMVSFITPIVGIGSDFLTQEFKNGFLLSPQDTDESGIGIDTAFFLSTQNDMTLEEISNGFSIDDEPKPKIQMQEDKKFRIELARFLLENTVYTFRLNVQGKPEITWAFQTRAPFSITGSLPGNQMNNVPLNSGIEIYFSHAGFEDVSPYFEIFPTVKGRFEIHDKTSVFVPEGLLEETLYTVKIKQGLKLSGTKKAIASDYSFSFETQKKDSATNNQDETKGQINYSRNILDVTSKIAPELPITYWVNNQVYKNSNFAVKTSLYTYESFEKFCTDYQEKQTIPNWAYYSFSKNFTSTNGLTKFMEFSQEFPSVQDYSTTNISSIKIPKELPIGYYLLDSYWEDIHFQTFLQVTNTGIYYTESGTKTLVWLNDMALKKPLANASVSYMNANVSYSSDENGVAAFDTVIDANTDSPERYLIVKTNDGKSSLLTCFSYNKTSKDHYWAHLQTDRGLYQPDDVVSIWGFLKSRYNNEEVANLTLELSGGGYYYHFRMNNQMPIIKKTLDVRNGFYSTQISLPNLEQGGYSLNVKKGDTIISSTYISVEKYTKPAYKLEISKDKNAVFPGEAVNFNIKTAFFEGTGVSNLSTDVFISDSEIGGNTQKSTGKTDLKGNMMVRYVPIVNESNNDLNIENYDTDSSSNRSKQVQSNYYPNLNNINYQGEKSVSIDARATLPEMGEINETSNVRVFINNVDVALESRMKDGEARLEATVKNIVLDRLNNGTATDYSDYLGAPVSNKSIKGTVYKNEWIEIEDGVYYDFINKVSQKKYRYELKKTPIKDIYMTTDTNGKAVFTFPLEKSKDEYYTGILECEDNTGKKMSFERYFWDYLPFYDTYITNPENIDNSYKLDGGRESYKIGETVDLTFKKGKNILPGNNFLYLVAQNGIREYFVSDKPTFNMNFSKNNMPNVTIEAINFDENSIYNTATFDARFQYQEQQIKMNARLDKNSYKPGEQAKIIIDVKDNNGNPVESTVNANIVDEAFLKLSDRNVDVLKNIFVGVSSGMYLHITSHSFDVSNIGFTSSFMDINYSKSSSLPRSVKESLTNIKSDGSSIVRSEFKDTAYFHSITTDKSGHGEINFKLPDNVTSWRVSLDGISQDLHAGSNKVDLKVSLPFFINYSFNSTYLVGDKPVIGVNAYGDGLAQNDLVMFEVSSIKNPELKVSSVGKAFERLNIPLWALVEGDDSLKISAYTNTNLADAMNHSYKVIKSYYQISSHKLYTIAPGLTIAGGVEGNTQIIFSDKGRGQFLSQLLGLAYPWGNRIDQKVSAKESQKLLNKHFKSEDYTFETTNFDVLPYQKTDGGISLMTYGESDLKLSSQLASQLKDSVDLAKLKMYFYNILNNKTSGTGPLALWGLASLKEPVLLDIERYSKIDNLTIQDSISLAFAYYELGAHDKAMSLYNEQIAKNLVTNAPYTFIASSNSKDNVLESTALCSLLAVKLNRPEKEGLYKYVIDNSSEDIYLGFLKLGYINNIIESFTDAKASFKYMYNDEEKTVDLKNGGFISLNIPSKLLPNLKIVSVEGDVSAVSIFKESIDTLNKFDNNLSITREYYHLDGKALEANSLKQGDVIKVRIGCVIDNKALDGEYEITDYLPSGLKPTEMSYDMNYYYRKIDGQKVKFSLYNWDALNDERTFEYFARVITPGTYNAQGTIIQNVKAPSSINKAPDQIINIDGGSEEIATPLDSNGIKVSVNDRNVVFDVAPIIDSGRMLVPLRSIFEVLGANVTWDDKTKTVTAQKGENKLILTLGSRIAMVNGLEKTLDVPATLLQNRTFVPTRFISEGLGANVTWDSSTRTAKIWANE